MQPGAWCPPSHPRAFPPRCLRFELVWHDGHTDARSARQTDGLRRLTAAMRNPVQPRDPPPVTREVVAHDGGTFEVVTPGRMPDRRSPPGSLLGRHGVHDAGNPGEEGEQLAPSSVEGRLRC